MCTPTKDQVIQHIRQNLDMAIGWIHEHAAARPPAFRTRPVKTALCNACHAAWGACGTMSIFATQVGHHDPDYWYDPEQPYLFATIPVPEPGDPPNPDRAAHQGEWLYDVTCLRYDEPWPTQQKNLLVAEVECGGRDSHAAVLDDFGKLLVVRAELRVMVYHEAHAPIEELAGYIQQCRDSQVGDTYLLATFADNQLTYHRIDVTPSVQVQTLP